MAEAAATARARLKPGPNIVKGVLPDGWSIREIGDEMLVQEPTGNGMTFKYGGVLAQRILFDLLKALAQWAASRGEPSAWLITGGQLYKDAIVQREAEADLRIANRGDGAQKIALYR